jgi:hypothetical protein
VCASLHRLSAYQSATKDIHELLLLDEMTDGRFSELESEQKEAASLFARAIRYGPFKELAANSGQWCELDELDEILGEYMPKELEPEMTVSFKGNEVDLSEVGATLYKCNMGTLIHVRNQFNTLLPDRVRQPQDPNKVAAKGLERRKQLTVFLKAINADQLKKGMKELDFQEIPTSKPACVDALIMYFCPKRAQKRKERPEDEPVG